MDIKKRADALGLEETEFREVVGLFLESSASDMADFHAALTSGDSQRASAAAHSIKGAALNLGFLDVSRTAGKMEHQTRRNDLKGLSNAAALLDRKIRRIAEGIMR